MKTRLVNAFLIIGLISVVFIGGYIANNQTKTVYAEKYVEIPKVEYQVIEKQVPVNEFREWESVEALKAWLKENYQPAFMLEPIHDGDTVTYYRDERFDCDDYTEIIQRKAYNDGYMLSQQIVDNGVLDNVEIKDAPTWQNRHMGLMAIIGNEIYYINSMGSTDSVILVCDRD